MSVAEFARRLGIRYGRLRGRLKAGYTPEECAQWGKEHIKPTQAGRWSASNSLSEQQAERLVKAKEAGATYEQLAERFGVSYMTAYRIVKRKGTANA